MTEEHISSETLPDGDNITPADGGETGSVGLAEMLNEELGKEFKDDESALKYLKDNDSYVGKARNYNPVIEKLENKYGSQDKLIQALNSMTEEKQVEQPVQPAEAPPAPINDGLVDEVSALKAQVNEANFYAENPNLKPYKAVISKLGSDPSAVMADEGNKAIIDKMVAHDEMENSKSVLQSNSRLGAVVDKQAKAREHMQNASKAAQAGDSYAAAQNESAARNSAVSSVIDAFGLGQ